ncbi:MAG: enoyl-CoA hydratase/isomerase family protein [Candidatus Binatia bacterium]
MSEYQTLILKIEDRAATLTLNRPDKLNAIDETMMTELRQVFTDLDADEGVCGIVLRAAGRAFCAGMDLEWSERLTKKDRVEQARMGQRIVEMMERASIPVIAAVHGYALGGGLEFALGADFIVAREDAKLGLPEITLSAQSPYRPKIAEDGDPDQPEFGGNGPGWGSLTRLPERIGKARTKELIFTGVRIDAQQALQIGLVNHVYSMEKFDEEVAELGRRIGAMNRYNLRLMKELLNKGYDWIEPHPS